MTSSTFVTDCRHAVRTLVTSPGFSIMAILTFAVGIGVNTAVFSVFNGVVLRALPYPDADRITMVWMDNRQQNIREDITSYPNYRDWRMQNTSYAHLAAFTDAEFNLTGTDEPERLTGAMTTANFFEVIGVQPIIGRLFTEAQETPGSDAVVLLSYGLWQRKFGGSPTVLGRTMTLNGRPHEIIGVMPASLRVPPQAELWKPLAPDDNLRDARSAFWLPVIGRLKPGVSVDQAQGEMSAIASRLEEYPGNRGFGIYVVGLQQQIVGGIEKSLTVLLAAVAFVLLIACANLGNLLLGRTAARRKELAIRTALGARRSRLIRQIVSEALVLAAAGSGVGLIFAYWGTGFFVAVGGDSIPRPEAISIDGRVLLFTLVLAVVAALTAGIFPALRASKAEVTGTLREGGREGGQSASRRTRSVLIAVEVALAFVLLSGAGLLLRTLWSMQHVDRGFTADRIATMRLSLPATLYAGPAEVTAFYSRLLERVRALPGVESAATGTGVLQPLVANSNVFTIEGRPAPPPGQQVEYPIENVSPGYFETLGVALQSGRTFTPQDHVNVPPVVIVNETLARQGWPGQDPIGRRIRGGGPSSNAPWLTVVGVVRDLRRADLRREIRPELYLCTLQRMPRSQMLLVRTAGDPSSIVAAVRREVQALNPQLPLYAVGTLHGQLAATLRPARFAAVLLATFALIAVLLAAIGIYGVTSHAVGQRTHEVGIRMALGARRADVLRLMIAQHLRPAVAGVILGAAGALLLSGALRTMVYGVGVADPLTYGVMAAGLLTITLLACWLPSRRATRVDPLVALRSN